MPLTPQDVENKDFKLTFRGYHVDEVDAFLDEVQGELARLLRENDELRRYAEAVARAGVPQPVAPAPAAPATQVTVAAEPGAEPGAEAAAEAAAGLVAQEVPVPAPVPVAPAAPVAEPVLPAVLPSDPVLAGETEGAALRTLLLAQRTADEAIAEARAEAERIVAAAQGQAASVEQETAVRVAEALGSLESRKVALEAQIDDLRAFEREYRLRLTAYLQDQLDELAGRGGGSSGGVVDGADALGAGAGVPAAAAAGAIGAPAAPEAGEASPFAFDPPTSDFPTVPAPAPDAVWSSPAPAVGAFESVQSGSTVPTVAPLAAAHDDQVEGAEPPADR